jgi:hypothetical protein
VTVSVTPSISIANGIQKILFSRLPFCRHHCIIADIVGFWTVLLVWMSVLPPYGYLLEENRTGGEVDQASVSDLLGNQLRQGFNAESRLGGKREGC